MSSTFAQVKETKSNTALSVTGFPEILHYNKNDFNADPQFWAMCEDQDGVLYFGNNDGIIIFDGETWQKVYLPNGASVRSLIYTSGKEVFVGGFNEFGKVKVNSQGVYFFESLVQLLPPENQNFENVWNIHEVDEKLIFRSFRQLMLYDNKKVTLLPADHTFNFSGAVSQNLFIKDHTFLKSFDVRKLQYQEILNIQDINNEEIVSILEGFDPIYPFLIITKQGSIFGLDIDSKKVRFIKRIIPDNASNLITSAIKSSNGKYYFGTLNTNLLEASFNGEELVVSQAFRYNQSQTVLNIYQSKKGNLWSLLNNGLDFIELSSPVSTIFDQASVYDAVIMDKKMIIATNQGVYFSEQNENQNSYQSQGFQSIKGLEGQAWSINIIGQKVLISHDKGLFSLGKNGYFSQVNGVYGVWKTIPIRGSKDRYLACTYEGIYLVVHDQIKDDFIIKQKIDGFAESSRDILQSKSDPSVFWVCHGYKGVYKLRLSENFDKVIGIEHFKDQNGLPSHFSVNVFEFNDKEIFTSNHGIYIYDELQNSFKPFDKLNNFLDTSLNVRSIQKYEDKIWFVQDDEAGFIRLDKNGDPFPGLNKNTFLNLKGDFNRSMELILPINQHRVLMGTRTGLYAYQIDQESNDKPYVEIHFRKISYQIPEGEELATLPTGDERINIPNDASNIKIHLAAPSFAGSKNTQYSYLLEGMNTTWTNWESKPAIEFNFLKSGQYTLHVKARNQFGLESQTRKIQFYIMPKWFQTTWFFGFLLAFISITLIIIYQLVLRKILREKEKTRKEEEEKAKVLELKIQQMKLEHEKKQIEKDKEMLEEDVVFKSKELANYTMLLVNKKDLLQELKDGLDTIKTSTTNEKIKSRLGKLQHRIQTNLSNEEHLKVFDANFERVHQQFFDELKASFPFLNGKDLRLCAFVKMNLTNKEIATILNISVRGVETARYRLRKRLSLGHDVNMAEFLDSLSQHEDGFEPDESQEL
ncbi:triple tyrosine motif-containing protein [Belliella filtrata]|uniref:triple tyrosine motif-containing protein n=1 Tax=Belliella filtrata TaxID=2923435 RepID=UPI001F4A35C3|nr:triple tyrosine motif-containing protein [Belliella filtrata]